MFAAPILRDANQNDRTRHNWIERIYIEVRKEPLVLIPRLLPTNNSQLDHCSKLHIITASIIVHTKHIEYFPINHYTRTIPTLIRSNKDVR